MIYLIPQYMDQQTMDTLKQHIKAFVIGLLSVMATNALLAGLQYLGTHLPDAVGALSQIAVAYGSVKKTLN